MVTHRYLILIQIPAWPPPDERKDSPVWTRSVLFSWTRHHWKTEQTNIPFKQDLNFLQGKQFIIYFYMMLTGRLIKANLTYQILHKSLSYE